MRASGSVGGGFPKRPDILLPFAPRAAVRRRWLGMLALVEPAAAGSRRLGCAARLCPQALAWLFRWFAGACSRCRGRGAGRVFLWGWLEPRRVSSLASSLVGACLCRLGRPARRPDGYKV